MAAESGSAGTLVDRCWCCGRDVPSDQLVRLTAHPEVGVCAACARQLKRRAMAREDEHRRSPGAVVRRGVQGLRGAVIARGWHERGRLGSALRRIDRHLP